MWSCSDSVGSTEHSRYNTSASQCHASSNAQHPSSQLGGQVQRGLDHCVGRGSLRIRPSCSTQGHGRKGQSWLPEVIFGPCARTKQASRTISTNCVHFHVSIYLAHQALGASTMKQDVFGRESRDPWSMHILFASPHEMRISFSTIM
jgi:hypothetical protein